MFTFNDIEESQSSFKPTLNPGLHEVVILGYEIKEPEDETKSKYAVIKYTNLEATRQANIKFYINDVLKPGKLKTALDISLSNFKHIANNCDLTEADKTKIKGNSKQELLESMIKVCTGKPYRQKFTGEEYLDREGKIQVKVGIGFPNFAESLKIPAAETKLLYKESDPYDYRRLPADHKQEVALPDFLVVTPEPPKNADGKAITDDLPF